MQDERIIIHFKKQKHILIVLEKITLIDIINYFKLDKAYTYYLIDLKSGRNIYFNEFINTSQNYHYKLCT